MEKHPTFLLLLIYILITEVCQAADVIATTMVSKEEVTAVPVSLTDLKVERKQILAAQFECYLKIQSDSPPNGPGPYCNRTWDGWLCWEDSAPGIAVQTCPNYFQDFDIQEKVTKVCNPDGQWFRHPESNRLWSNYTQCIAYTKQRLVFARSMYYLTIVGHVISLISLLISIFIFSYFKCLSCQRIILHKNMFMSFILNSIANIIWITMTYSRDSVNQIGCKILTTLVQYTFCSTCFWMLCEGIYLHTLIIVAVFVGEQQLGWYYLLGWGFPVLPALTHAVARLYFYDDQCWFDNTSLIHIVHGPIQVALVVNLFFLLNIVRVLITKLRVTHKTETNVYMKAVRATLILVPLMGAHFLSRRPENKLASTVYEFLMCIFMHCQGLLVAIILCFANTEVHSAIRRKLEQYRVQCRHRLVTTDSHITYHTNTSITETSRGNLSLEPVATDENTTAHTFMLNGHSNGKRYGDEEKLTTLQMTQV